MQIADILLLYETGSAGIREAKRETKKISPDLIKILGERLAGEDILFIKAYGYVKAVLLTRTL